MPASAGDMGSIPGREDPLEKEMITHSSILAWKPPWTGEPGGLQSIGSLIRALTTVMTNSTEVTVCDTEGL